MTTPTIQKIATVLKAANEEIYAHVRYNFRHKTWEVWVYGKPVEVNFKSHDEAEDRCENLNYEYAAKKVMEVLENSAQSFSMLKLMDNLDKIKPFYELSERK